MTFPQKSQIHCFKGANINPPFLLESLFAGTFRDDSNSGVQKKQGCTSPRVTNTSQNLLKLA